MNPFPPRKDIPRQHNLVSHGNPQHGESLETVRPTSGHRRVQTWLSQVQDCATGKWLQDIQTSDSIAEFEPTWRPHNLPLSHNQATNLTSVRQRPQHFSRDSILRSPSAGFYTEGKWHHERTRLPTGIGSSSSERPQSVESSQLKSVTPQAKTYERRSRRRTRENRYESKRCYSKHDHERREEHMTHPRSKRRKIGHDQLKSGKELMESFSSDYLGKTRVTVKPNLTSSSFEDCKLSRPFRMSDLEFNDMACVARGDSAGQSQATQSKPKKQSHLIPKNLEEDSAFFKDTRKRSRRSNQVANVPIRPSVEQATSTVRDCEESDDHIMSAHVKRALRRSTNLSASHESTHPDAVPRHQDTTSTAQYAPRLLAHGENRPSVDAVPHDPEDCSESGSVIPESVWERLIASGVFDFLPREAHRNSDQSKQSRDDLCNNDDTAQLQRQENRESRAQLTGLLVETQNNQRQSQLQHGSGVTQHQGKLSNNQKCHGSGRNQESVSWGGLRAESKPHFRSQDESNTVFLNDPSFANTAKEDKQGIGSETIHSHFIPRDPLSPTRQGRHNAWEANQRYNSREGLGYNLSPATQELINNYQPGSAKNPQEKLHPHYQPLRFGKLDYRNLYELPTKSPEAVIRHQVMQRYSHEPEDLLKFIECTEREVLGYSDLEGRYRIEGPLSRGHQTDQPIYEQSHGGFRDPKVAPGLDISGTSRARALEEQEMRAFWRPNHFLR